MDKDTVKTETFYVLGKDRFRVEAKIHSHLVEYKVYKGNPEERYLAATIRWDECSHFRFGEEGTGGYLHICGYDEYLQHVKLIQVLHTKTQGYLEDSMEFTDWDWQHLIDSKEE